MTILNFDFQIIRSAACGACIVSSILPIIGLILVNTGLEQEKTKDLINATAKHMEFILNKVICFTLYLHGSLVVEALGHVVSLCPIHVKDFIRFPRVVSFHRHWDLGTLRPSRRKVPSSSGYHNSILLLSFTKIGELDQCFALILKFI